ncbi:hypothetical protein A5N15_06505 [Rothia kristinae]|uniref:Uncharacterized protein n=1 Tax=Rothia kristinae TaxID=37923 RepID=A0A657IVV2_9MICC|nr:hypothetical protein A5N15_06505 [Rothia kristinae]
MSEQLLRTVPHPAKSALPAYAAQIFLRVLRGSMSPEAAAASREVIRELPELRQRMKIHMLRCEQALQQFLLGMDWAAYAERGELVPRTEPDAEPDPEQVRRVRALVLLSAAILRHIDFGAGREIDEADAQIARSAALFSQILQEDVDHPPTPRVTRAPAASAPQTAPAPSSAPSRPRRPSPAGPSIPPRPPASCCCSSG